MEAPVSREGVTYVLQKPILQVQDVHVTLGGNLILREVKGYLIRLRDVGRAELGPRDSRVIARFNGNNAVSVTGRVRRPAAEGAPGNEGERV